MIASDQTEQRLAGVAAEMNSVAAYHEERRNR